MADTGNKSASSLSERVRSLRLTESSEPTGNPLWWLPWLLCAALTVIAGFTALEAFSAIDDETIKKLAEERGLNVGKQSSEKSDALKRLGMGESDASAATEIALESKGYIVPFSLIQVSPKISGTVMNLYIKEGMEIKPNSDHEYMLLAKLEDVEYKSDWLRATGVKLAAQARLDELKTYRKDEERQAKAELDDTKAQYVQAELKYQRAVKLNDKTAISDEDYELAESAYRSLKFRVERLQLAYNLWVKGPRDARIAGAEAELNQADADLIKAKWRYDNTKVYAPIKKGIILSKKTEEGNIVNPSAFSNGLSASLCELADLHDLEVDLSIAERDISKIFADQDCRVRAEAFPNRIYPGFVSRIMPMGDRAKSSVPVRVKILFPAVDANGKALPKDEQGQFLRPEMGAIVTFLNRKAPGKN
jgi:HlyD family secretion protein